MDFAFTADQEMLRSSAREWMADRWPMDRVVAAADGADRGFDASAWRELAGLGWLDPELDMLDLAVLAEEAGMGLLPLPWWSSAALAGPLLEPEQREAVASGERAVTLAWAEPGRSHRLADAPSAATVSADAHGRLTGSKVLVPDLAVVTDAIVVAKDGLHLVDLTAHPEAVVRRSTIDGTRPLGELRLEAVPARKLDADPRRLGSHRLAASALLACEAVGVAQRALDLAGAHTKERTQFGRVIGTYQGVSHRVANTYLTTQLARSVAYWAAWTVSEGDPSAPLAVAAAKSQCAESAVFACEQAIQVHGGIGFTWEHALHRYYKRAQWIDGFDGSGRNARAEIAVALLDGDESMSAEHLKEAS